MFQLRISLKWFLLATAGVAALIGTIGKDAYLRWRERQYLARQEQIRVQLMNSACYVEMRSGRVVEIRCGEHASMAAIRPLLAEAVEVERVLVYCPADDEDVAVLTSHSRIEHLCISGPGVTNRSLALIARLPNLKCLTIGRASITDDGFKALGRLETLKQLSVGICQISGRGLQHLTELPALNAIHLNDLPVQDDALNFIGAMENLEFVYLTNTRIDGSGLVHLKHLSKLSKLRLDGTNLSHGDGLADLDAVERLYLSNAQLEPGVLEHISGMESLRYLSLFRANLSDEILRELTSARQIQQLRLSQTQITDASVFNLESLSGLQFLDMGQTHVTASGAKRLSQALPNTSIFYEGGSFGPRWDPRKDPLNK
jgi:hypothetical protein